MDFGADWPLWIGASRIMFLVVILILRICFPHSGPKTVLNVSADCRTGDMKSWSGRKQDQFPPDGSADSALCIFRHSAAGQNQSGQRNSELLRQVTHLLSVCTWTHLTVIHCVCVGDDAEGVFVLCVQTSLPWPQQLHFLSASPQQPAEENYRRGTDRNTWSCDGRVTECICTDQGSATGCTAFC